MTNICATCLSTNRQLFPFQRLNITWINVEFCKGDKVCWECRRLFVRVQAFLHQVTQAQKFLNSRTKKQKKIVCLSTLGIFHKDSYDRIYLDDEVVKPESPLEPKDEFPFEVKADLGVEAEIPVSLVFSIPGTSGNIAISLQDPLDKPFSEGVQVAAAGIEPTTLKPNDEHGNNSLSSDNEAQQESTDWQDLVPSLSELECKESNRKKFSGDHLIKNVTEEVMLQARYDEMKRKSYINGQYKCETCVLSFKLEQSYLKHMEKHSPEAGNFMCPICQQRCKDMAQARKHFLNHYRFFQCGSCQFTHHKLGTVQRHYESEHEAEKIFQCHLCEEQFLTRRKKKQHVEAAHKTAPECPHCQKTFSNACNLKIHLRTHTEQPRLECNICHKHYKGEKNLEIHMRTHTAREQSEEAYCAECDIRFKGRFMYLSHLKYSSRHITEDSFRYQCDECGRKYTMKHYLEEHIEREHLRILQYTCDQCEQKFVSRRQKRHHVYKVHKMNGVVDKRATCQICRKEFVSARTCKIHQRVHTGERPYHCHLCPMRFSQKSTLKTHLKGKHKKEFGVTC